ncbi:unnamed protein product [Gongylonema pulchrum]|uniref:Secreted protein n=1 Tax=Gongylonema pulchrum TaxID=637853 RepID=A0A183EM02_9BILA|nr:unnamed protein product [Gongylonema pulchrum]
MFTFVKTTIIVAWFVRQAQAAPLLDSGLFKSESNEAQFPCRICEDERLKDQGDIDEVNHETLFEYDKTMGTGNLDEIENEVLLINVSAWLQEPTDAKNLKQEVEQASSSRTKSLDVRMPVLTEKQIAMHTRN